VLPTDRQRDADRPAAHAALTGPLTVALTGVPLKGEE
jgi:hypothetical protein